MKDDRLYMRFPIEFPDDPKIAPLSVEAKWALVEMVSYSRRQDLDGVIPRKYAEHRWGTVLTELLDADPVSPFLAFDEVYGYTLTKYGRHQDTKADREARSQRMAELGRSGALAKSKRAASDSASAPLAADVRDGKRVSSEGLAESESESESESPLTDVTNSLGQSPTQSAPLSTDQERLIVQAKAHALSLGVADLPAMRDEFERKLGLVFNLGQAAELCEWVLQRAKAAPANPVPYIIQAVRKSAPEWRDRAKQLGCEVAA